MALRDLYSNFKKKLEITEEDLFPRNPLKAITAPQRVGSKIVGGALTSLLESGAGIGKGAVDYARQETRDPSKNLGQAFSRLVPQAKRGLLTGLQIQGAASPKTFGALQGLSTTLDTAIGGKKAGLRSLSQQNIGRNLQTAGLISATNPLADKAVRGLGVTKFIPRNTIIGAGNVGEDVLLDKLRGEKSTPTQYAASFLTPAFLEVAGKLPSDALKRLGIEGKKVLSDERGEINWQRMGKNSARKTVNKLEGKKDTLTNRFNVEQDPAVKKRIQTQVDAVDDNLLKYDYKIAKGDFVTSPIRSAEDDLIQEARKYKSAEEFINNNKFFRGEGGSNGGGNYFTKSEEFANEFAGIKPLTEAGITDVYTPSKLPFAGNEQEITKAISEAKSKGYKAVKVSEGSPFGEPIESVFVFDKSAIKTKSQLTDIWNKANKPNIFTDESGGVTPDAYLPKRGSEERGFIETIKESEKTPKVTKQRLEQRDITYNPKPNEQTIKRASEAVNKDLLGEYTKIVSGKQAMTAEDVTKAHILIQELNRGGNIEAAVDVAEAVAKQGTQAGQAVQAFSIYDKLSPEGMLVYGNREIGRATGGKLSPEGAQQIISIMKQAQVTEDPALRGSLMKKAMEVINKEIPPSFSELFDSYRYEGMLSNPRTQMRNIYGNLLQTFVTKPATIVAEVPFDWVRSTLTGAPRQRYLSDMPDYYRGAINSIPNAAEAFKLTMRGEIPLEHPDLGVVRRAGRSGPVSRFMEGIDRFNQTIIGSSEYADLIKKGVSEADAKTMAEANAKYWLFRTRPDPANASGQGLVLSKIDAFSKAISELPGRKWMIPFIQTPTNVAKQWIEFSPAGLATIPGNKAPTKQLAKASLGSIAMLIGAKLAAEGNTSWTAPTDPADKQTYYATGRKPMSVKIGDTWVPMVYFGPFALALAGPAALEHYDKYEPGSVSKTDGEKLIQAFAGLYQTLTDQTFFSGLNNYIQILSGDPDYNLGSSTGFTASQVVPYTGLLNYINSIIDPTMRKKKTFGQAFLSGIPGLSGQNPPYLEPGGVPVQRDPVNYVTPYDVGISDDKYEPVYQRNIQEQQYTPLKSWKTKIKKAYMDEARGLISEQERDAKLKDLQKEYDTIMKNLNKGGK